MTSFLSEVFLLNHDSSALVPLFRFTFNGAAGGFATHEGFKGHRAVHEHVFNFGEHGRFVLLFCR